MANAKIYNKGLLEGLDIKGDVVLRVMKCLELCIAGDDAVEDEDFVVLQAHEIVGYPCCPADKAGCKVDEFEVCMRIMRAYHDERNSLLRTVINRFMQTGMNTWTWPTALRKQAALKAATELQGIGSREVLSRSWECPADISEAKDEFHRLVGIETGKDDSTDQTRSDRALTDLKQQENYTNNTESQLHLSQDGSVTSQYQAACTSAIVLPSAIPLRIPVS